MGRHQGMDRPGVQQVQEGSGEQGKMEKTGCKLICGAPTTLVVKGLMMMMMIVPKKKRKKRPHRLLKNGDCSHFLQMGGCTSLPFMRLINYIFGRIFAIPHLRKTLTL